MNRLILRFGNQKADTIASHSELIDTLDHVWWGWWAKAWERVPGADTWSDIVASMKSGVRVGLFDRRALRFYVAMCDDVHLTDGVSRIQSPEPAATPDYYSDEYFPVWFRLSSIDAVTEPEFLDEFGFVPISKDETLYWSDPASPPELTSLDVVTTRSLNILHISDLHFGEDFAYPHTTTAVPGTPNLEDVLSDYIRDAEFDVGIVVVSGDLVTRGIERYFRDVTTFLDGLLTRLGLSRNHTVVVPGNHDLWLDDDAAFTYSHTYAHELGYREWYDSFMASKNANLSLERLKVFEHAGSDSAAAFIQVNSARLRERETMEFGYVGSHRYIPLLRALNDVDKSGMFRFFVMHHHLVPVPGNEHVRPGRPVSVTVDSGHIIENLQRYGVQCVLHGHQHLPFVGSIGRMSFDEYGDAKGHVHPIAVLGAGSVGAKSDRLSAALRANTFGLYRLTGGEMSVRVVQFAPGGSARTWAATSVPLGTAAS